MVWIPCHVDWMMMAKGSRSSPPNSSPSRPIGPATAMTIPSTKAKETTRCGNVPCFVPFGFGICFARLYFEDFLETYFGCIELRKFDVQFPKSCLAQQIIGMLLAESCVSCFNCRNQQSFCF